MAEWVKASFVRRPWSNGLGSTLTPVTLLCPWIIRFMMIISAWWLWTSSKVSGHRGVAKNGGTRGRISWCHPWRLKYSWRPKKYKKKRSSLQNNLVFSPKVCNDQKKRYLPPSQWVFGLKKNKWCHPKMVTPGASRPPPHPSNATEWTRIRRNSQEHWIIGNS